MLIEFRVKNFRSVRDEQVLSLESEKACSELSGVLRRPRGVAAHSAVLPAAAIFGANASGKTSLIRAMHTMQEMVLHSFGKADEKDSPIHDLVPFKLNPTCDDDPVELEATFVTGGVRHQYGFRVRNKSESPREFRRPFHLRPTTLAGCSLC